MKGSSDKFDRNGAAQKLLIVICVLAGGWGPADYQIPLGHDIYILRNGGNRFSLCRELPSPNGGQSKWYETLCEGVQLYGTSDGVIYGSTTSGTYFVLALPESIHMYRTYDQFLDAIRKLDVSLNPLVVPQPPHEDFGLFANIGPAFYASVVGVAATAILFLVFRHRGNKALSRRDG